MCQGLMNTEHQLSHHNHHDPHHDHDDDDHPRIISTTATTANHHQQPRPSAPATIPPFATLLHNRQPRDTGTASHAIVPTARYGFMGGYASCTTPSSESPA